MFMAGQVVFDREKQEPCFACQSKSHREIHFIKNTGRFCKSMSEYEVALPDSIESAKQLLKLGLITPAACISSHCPRCGNWWSNHEADGSCFSHVKTKIPNQQNMQKRVTKYRY